MKEQKYEIIEHALQDDLKKVLENKPHYADLYINSITRKAVGLMGGAGQIYAMAAALGAKYYISDILNNESAEQNQGILTSYHKAFFLGTTALGIGSMSAVILLYTTLTPWFVNKIDTINIRNSVKYDIAHIVDACIKLDKENKREYLSLPELSSLKNYYQLALMKGKIVTNDNEDKRTYEAKNEKGQVVKFDLSLAQSKVLKRVINNFNFFTASAKRIPIFERIENCGEELITPKELNNINERQKNLINVYYQRYNPNNPSKPNLDNNNWNDLVKNTRLERSYINTLQKEREQQQQRQQQQQQHAGGGGRGL